MIDPKIFDPLKSAPASESSLLGIVHALQTLASAVLDDNEKRDKVARVLEELSEAALLSDLSQDRRQNYLDMLGSVGVAASVAKRL